jgi:Flp pilus assembly protein TadG
MHDERGSAVVEFALTVPLLLLVAIALVQIAVVGRDRLVIEHAARAGARVAAVETDDASVRAAVVDAAPGLDPSTISVTVTRGSGFGTPVEVAVSYGVPIALPLAGWLLPASVHLSEAVAMRQEFG